MELSYYDKIGDAALRQLIHDFYAEIQHDPIMSPMYEGDFEGAEERLYLFMVQYLGGPTTYSEQRGHPALRKRHFPFPVDTETIGAWLKNMDVALAKSTMKEEHKTFLKAYFEKTAHFLRNRED
jgi:hemoglobin